MRLVLPASLLVATLVLTGCVATESDRLAASARAAVASLAGLNEEERLTVAMTLAAAHEADARAVLGVDDALGGTAASDAIFESLHAQLPTDLEAPAAANRIAPASFAGATGAPGVLETFIGTGFTAIGWLGEDGMNSAERGDVGTRTDENDGRRIETTISENGDVESSYSTEMSANGSQASISASTTLSPCPDADGRLELEGSTRVRFSSATVTMDISIDVSARATLSDAAEYATREHEYRYQTAATVDGVGEFFDHSATSDGGLTVNRASSKATFEFQQGAVDAAAVVAAFVADQLYENAKRGWESGRCVSVDVSPSADAQNLEPGSDTEIEVAPRSTRDGRPTGGTVVTTLSGDGSLDRAGGPVNADATYVYTAADEKDRFGTLTIEARSKRGIGRTTFEVGTGGRAYRADGSEGDFVGTGTVCSLTDPFTFGGGGHTFTFFPADRNGGTFQMTGSQDGVSFRGDGTYTVQWANESLATSFLIDGELLLSTPEGYTTTTPADLLVTLTPIEACD